MAGITLETAQSMLDLYVTAAEAVATGQSYAIGKRSLTRANLKEINDAIDFWEKRVVRLTNGGITVKGATPC